MPDLSLFSMQYQQFKNKVTASCFFHCLARYAVGINHRRSRIGMAQHHLGRKNIAICLQKMRSKPSVETHKIRGSGLEKLILLIKDKSIR